MQTPASEPRVLGRQQSDPKPSVLLLGMPWGDVQNPSLALGILKACLVDKGMSCTVRHLNLRLLKYLEPESYKRFADLYAVNDFLFTRVLQEGEVTEDQLSPFRELVTSDQSRIDLLGRRELDPAPYLDFALAVRDRIIPQYLEDCLSTIDFGDVTMVGFSCLFDQTFASLALAKLIKLQHPSVLTVFGGYALEGPIGSQLIRCFPFVDVVVYGEGEERIVSLADASIDRSLLQKIPGILFRDGERSVRATAPVSIPVDLDRSPTPDFDDWFEDLAFLEEDQEIRIETEFLPVESSRGCWWGQTSHCVFCGIDDETMRYRVKSPSRVMDDLHELKRRYSADLFRFSDYILPYQYYRTLLPDLAGNGENMTLHWEIKSNISYEDVLTLRRARVLRVQPGIESFSSPVLKRMGKGVTGIQNVFAIRALTENYIDVYYNVIYGFPGDTAAEYRELVRAVPSLYHFSPPGAFLNVLTTRFSPMHTDAGRFGFDSPLVAEPRYRIMFSERYRSEIGFSLEDYCYVFKMPYELADDLAEQIGLLTFQLHHWRELWTERRVRLSCRNNEGQLEFLDSRFSPEPRLLQFGAEHQSVHELLRRRIRTRKQLTSDLRGRHSPRVVDAVVDELLAERLLFAEGERLVGIAIPREVYDWADRHEHTVEAGNAEDCG